MTPEDDYERLAERLYNQYPYADNPDEFEKAFDDYMEDAKLNARTYDKLKQKSLSYFIDKKTELGGSFERRRPKQKLSDRYPDDKFSFVGYIRREVKGRTLKTVVLAKRSRVKSGTGYRFALKDRFGRFVAKK